MLPHSKKNKTTADGGGRRWTLYTTSLVVLSAAFVVFTHFGHRVLRDLEAREQEQMAAVAKLQIEVQALRKQLRPAKNYSEYAAAHQKSDHVVELERLIQRAGPDDVAELHNHSASHDAIDHVARIHDMITEKEATIQNIQKLRGLHGPAKVRPAASILAEARRLVPGLGFMEMERPPTLQTFPETFGAGERRCLLWNGRCTPMACSNSSSQARRRNKEVRAGFRGAFELYAGRSTRRAPRRDHDGQCVSSKRHKFVYVRLFRAAGASMLRFLADGLECPLVQGNLTCSKDLLQLSSCRTALFNNSDAFRFSFVRHPFGRAIR